MKKIALPRKTDWTQASAPLGNLAERLTLSERQVQRHIANLEKAGFVKRIGRTAQHHGKISNLYDLSGLVNKLKALEPQFRAVAEEAKARQKAVAKPNYQPPGITG